MGVTVHKKGTVRQWSAVGLGLICLCLQARAATTTSEIGYVYPAGAQRGTTTRVVMGGQQVRGAEAVLVSRQGVSAQVVKWLRPTGNVNTEQRWLVMTAAHEAITHQLRDDGVDRATIERLSESLQKQWPWSILKKPDFDVKEETMPSHPLLIDLEQKSIPDVWHALDQVFFPRQKMQLNRQLAEWVIVDVTVAENAEEGIYELRLQTPQAITAPVRFEVSAVQELQEREPNNPGSHSLPPRVTELREKLIQTPVAVPFVMNGQIMPGDSDRFTFTADAGTHLSIRANARRLIPYLADAVPGWFQAVLILRDADGTEIAYADDNAFDPDPVLHCRIPRSGVYELEIHDAIYRGRQDFVYRVYVEETDGPPAPVLVNLDPGLILPMGSHAESAPPEREENGSREKAQPIASSALVRGAIGEPGDIDWYRIDGSPGDRVAIEVYGRRLGSPLDSLVRLTDANGSVIAWNDDHTLKLGHLHIDELGTMTHHADSVLLASPSNAPPWFIQVSDTRGHGSPAHLYLLRAGSPQPDFVLRVTPSAVQLKPGGVIPMRAYVMRKEGADGPIDISLADEPAGFELHGARIDAGKSVGTFTLRAPKQGSGDPTQLQFRGEMKTDGKVLSRNALPADDTMQAFLWRHLVPAAEQICVVAKQKWVVPRFEIEDSVAPRLGPGRRTKVHVRAPRWTKTGELRLRLEKPPAGISVSETVIRTEKGFTFELQAESSAQLASGPHTLLLEVLKETVPRGKDKDGKAKKPKTWPLTYLPACTVEWTPASSG